MATRDEIRTMFSSFFAGTGGIDSWLNEDTPQIVFDRLGRINDEPLTLAQLNQLLVLSHEAGMSDGFYTYYWLREPAEHPYPVDTVAGFAEAWTRENCIQTLDHLRWGFYRYYIDALLFFGNVRMAYRTLRVMNQMEIERLFASKRYDTDFMQCRGPALTLESIQKDDRYLISEMACKSYGGPSSGDSEMKEALLASLGEHLARGGGRVRIRDLLDGSYAKKNYADRSQQLLFSADAILEEEVSTSEDLLDRYQRIAEVFTRSRAAALRNTQLYLSMSDQLDVYVATSMRTRSDFRDMADFCEKVFTDTRLQRLHVRYFDPTIGAADGHEDKGLIECLMVKSAKALVYCAGTKDSYGKDAEAAMALSLGKPVIFYCDEEQKSRFFREVHPLSRLIHFETGVPVGAMVASRPEDVSELLYRVFENKMQYTIEQPRPGYLRLYETLTQSVVRLQTSDELLRETFWNYYHNKR